MFDRLWKNVTIATMAGGDGYGIINNGLIGVTGGKIAFVGTAGELPAPPEKLSDYVFDAEQRVATPGLIDCHSHLVYAGNRADEFERRLLGVSYAEIAAAGGGILSTVRATRDVTEDDLLEISLKRLSALFFDGVTTIEIKSGYGLDLDTERKMLRVATRLAEETGFRVQRTFLGAHALPPEFAGRSDDYVAHVCDMLRQLHRDKLIDAVDAFCEKIGFTQAQTRDVFECARELGIPVKLHAEQLSNMEGAQLAAEFRALSADHLEYVSEDGVKAMAAAGTVAVLLPGAFYYLREKTLPPIELFRQYKVPMAIATDHNPGTSPVLSATLMINMACTLFRMTPAEALAGMTRNAARALGLHNICGTLEKDKAADIALWNVKHPRELAYGFGSRLCHGVMMAGDWHPQELE
ncbi:MAG TPA: imidazolonepropionase [Patescibacteria group bacterium]|nr:imidazolonepropionase [Patescibacteria group bacterium]